RFIGAVPLVEILPGSEALQLPFQDHGIVGGDYIGEHTRLLRSARGRLLELARQLAGHAGLGGENVTNDDHDCVPPRRDSSPRASAQSSPSVSWSGGFGDSSCWYRYVRANSRDCTDAAGRLRSAGRPWRAVAS